MPNAGALEEREKAEEVFSKEGLNYIAHDRDDNENAQETVDNAGDGGEQINKEFQGIGETRGGKFGQKKWQRRCQAARRARGQRRK